MRILAVFFLVMACATGASAQALSRSEAVARALAANMTIKLSQEQVALLEGRIVEAKADALPDITWNTAVSRFRDPSLLNSPGFDDFPPEFRDALAPIAANAFTTTADVRQTLFSFKLNKAIQAARAARIAGEQDTERARQATALDAIRAYNQLLFAIEQLRVIQTNVQSKQTHADYARNRRTAGVATELEVLRAEVDLENARAEVAAGRKRSCRRPCRAQHRPAAADHDADSADGHAGGGAFQRRIRGSCRRSAHGQARAAAAPHAGACADTAHRGRGGRCQAARRVQRLITGWP